MLLILDPQIFLVFTMYGNENQKTVYLQPGYSFLCQSYTNRKSKLRSIPLFIVIYAITLEPIKLEKNDYELNSWFIKP